MRIDMYTKTVLTVIALCLVWLCVRDHATIPPVMAQAKAGPNAVVITGVQMSGGVIPVSIRDISVIDPYANLANQRTNILPVNDRR